MSAVEEADDGRVDVPDLVRSAGADSDARLRRMDSLTWTPPAVSSNKSVPRRRRGEDLADALREDGVTESELDIAGVVNKTLESMVVASS